MRDTRCSPEVQIHKESYILVEGLTKSQVSLNPFLTQVITKMLLSYLLSQRWVIQTSQGSPHKAVGQGQPLTI
jgi:hypothetical protein